MTLSMPGALMDARDLAWHRRSPVLARLLLSDQLQAHFQPIADLAEGSVLGHEALIRGPVGMPLATPDALFSRARADGCEVEFEIECVRLALQGWAQHAMPGKLFINMSAQALSAALSPAVQDSAIGYLETLDLAPASIVIELTEHERVHDMASLQRAARVLHEHGVGLALDDFGDGRSSLRLWSELRPDLVKIDKYFTAGLETHPDKLQTLRALLQLASTFNSRLVAEGIETAEALRVLRDLGVHCGQGWWLGRPAATPPRQLPQAALEVIASRQISVLPEPRWAASRGTTARQMLVDAPALTPQDSNDSVFEIFNAARAPHALAIVDAERHPLALINRHQFMARYAKPYYRELFGRASCLDEAHHEPLCVDAQTAIEELTTVLTAADQRYLLDGFVITVGGRYCGLGTGESLVKAVTETRIEAARHANPLTNLPGNIPISQHIDRLLRSTSTFAAAYFDLDHFKPFNDQYGYWRGDDMIHLAARSILAHTDRQRDFVGHVGGDDFVVLFQTADWARRCEAIVQTFNAHALELFDEADRQAGGIMAEDRFGTQRFHPCTTICAGVVLASGARFHAAEDVASAAAAAKRSAKHHGRAVHVLSEPDLAARASGAPA